VFDAAQSQNVSIDRSIHFDRTDVIFYEGGPGNPYTKGEKDREQRAPESNVDIETELHLGYLRLTLQCKSV
jgi:hypothetical protein